MPQGMRPTKGCPARSETSAPKPRHRLHKPICMGHTCMPSQAAAAASWRHRHLHTVTREATTLRVINSNACTAAVRWGMEKVDELQSRGGRKKGRKRALLLVIRTKRARWGGRGRIGGRSGRPSAREEKQSPAAGAAHSAGPDVRVPMLRPMPETLKPSRRGG